jgi:hypothetical protein
MYAGGADAGADAGGGGGDAGAYSARPGGGVFGVDFRTASLVFVFFSVSSPIRFLNSAEVKSQP